MMTKGSKYMPSLSCVDDKVELQLQDSTILNSKESLYGYISDPLSETTQFRKNINILKYTALKYSYLIKNFMHVFIAFPHTETKL